MTLRLACVSTAENTNRILNRLLTIAGGQVELALHLGDTTADYKASSLSRMNTRRGTKGHLMQDQRFNGAGHALLTNPDFAKNLEQFFDHMQRVGPSHAYRSHQLISLHDHFDYYHILSDVIAERLIRHQVTHVLFFNVPHMAYDTVLYHVAEALNLPCLIVTQSLFPGKFFSMRRPEDCGIFDPHSDAPPYPIEKGKPLDLFYMKSIRQDAGRPGRITAKAMLQLAAFLATKKPLAALNPLYLWRVLRQMQAVYGQFPDWRDPFARFFHTDALGYFHHLAQFEKTPIDLDQRFVYFPLQLQPEMTTAALGGPYRDQALAIEELAAILPPDVRIYIKENPKQGAFMRGPMFYHRLARIPAVRILPSFANTHALTDAAECVATISGTAAWEAIRKGKPALVFGAGWHQSLPGVTRWRPDLDYAQVINTPVDHAALERAVGTLLARAHDGVVERHYARLVAGYDVVSNDDETARTLLGLLRGEMQTTFGYQIINN